MTKIDDKISELESNLAIQRERFWDETDPEEQYYWKDAADNTKKDIAELRKEKAIIEKWRAIEAEPKSKTTETKSNTALRALVYEFGEDISADINHGECFYDQDMLRDFCDTLDKLKDAAHRYYVSNQKESEE